MITIQEYADKKHVSYEAIRKQVSRYEDELRGHLKRVDRKIYIDEEGEAFLDEKRRGNPIIIMENSRNEELEELQRRNEELQEENENLKKVIMELQQQITKLQQNFIAMQDDKMQLIKDAARVELLLEMKDKQEQDLEEAKGKIAELEAEAKSYRKTLFGLYRKN